MVTLATHLKYLGNSVKPLPAVSVTWISPENWVTGYVRLKLCGEKRLRTVLFAYLCVFMR